MNDHKYPVYDYFKFIWDKKLLLILATILFMIAGAAFSFTRTPSYTSKAVVFTGNGENDKLSKPGLISGEYKEGLPENLRASFDVKIVEPFLISLSLSGPDKNTVESELIEAAAKYEADLKERYNEQKGVWDDYTKALKAKVEKTEQLIDTYREISSTEKNEENLNRYTEILMLKEEKLPRYYADLKEAEYELKLLEEPELKKDSITTTASSNNLLRNILLGGAFGFQLMLLILVFWKYVLNARRSESQK
ncbi:Wzz/FepE/Etk N-terminal domain-containing protein [Mesobacillus subterraneus]|uniref:Wzz/FepE/Etk N-terminal domain-containing protein n=1 Tax=Mesobacillus subterraneus TaxID=285983 RepID=UPI00203B36BF|nr:Wzz/FepE/Etk N-terminal domain-containing protein [Mesobacillus subterraneus]MCM3663622.1 Wzz/FepE/Etk N-terminal domain-containing protein [Mesobacillus subterraneus]MCM3683388.1 Wzz/FepE/Etk N-terminal domain-containing protein [Mesobacillus subterraneus]